MQVIIHLKHNAQLDSLLKTLQEHDSVEWIETVTDNEFELDLLHKQLIDERLDTIEKGTASYTDWETIKKKYER